MDLHRHDCSNRASHLVPLTYEYTGRKVGLAAGTVYSPILEGTHLRWNLFGKCRKRGGGALTCSPKQPALLSESFPKTKCFDLYGANIKFIKWSGYSAHIKKPNKAMNYKTRQLPLVTFITCPIPAPSLHFIVVAYVEYLSLKQCLTNICRIKKDLTAGYVVAWARFSTRQGASFVRSNFFPDWDHQRFSATLRREQVFSALPGIHRRRGSSSSN